MALVMHGYPSIQIDVDDEKWKQFLRDLAELFEAHPDRAGPIRDRLLKVSPILTITRSSPDWPNLIVELRPNPDAVLVIGRIMRDREGWRREEWVSLDGIRSERWA